MTVNKESKGMLIGFVGILIFSLTLPVSKIAVLSFDPYFIAFGRACLAGLVCLYKSTPTSQNRCPEIYCDCIRRCIWLSNLYYCGHEGRVFFTWRCDFGDDAIGHHSHWCIAL